MLGLLGTVLALLFPFLPVVQETATITWPSATTGTRPVDAPLVAYRPETMSITVPCRAIQDLDGRTGPARHRRLDLPAALAGRPAGRACA